MVGAEVRFLLPEQRAEVREEGMLGAGDSCVPIPAEVGRACLLLQKGQATEHLAVCGTAGERLEQMSRVGREGE